MCRDPWLGVLTSIAMIVYSLGYRGGWLMGGVVGRL
jgi:hypothetical protein